jgi:hypothetical protein
MENYYTSFYTQEDMRWYLRLGTNGETDHGGSRAQPPYCNSVRSERQPRRSDAATFYNPLLLRSLEGKVYSRYC